MYINILHTILYGNLMGIRGELVGIYREFIPKAWE